MSELQQVIQQLNRDFVQALNQGDLDKAAAMFAPGGLIVPPGSAAVVNKPPLNNILKQLSAWNIEFNVADVQPLGASAAREVGTVRLVRKGGVAPMAPRNRGAAPAGAMQGQYLAVWESVGGEWKRNSLIWNRSAPAQRPGGNPGMRRGPNAQNMAGRPVYVPRTE